MNQSFLTKSCYRVIGNGRRKIHIDRRQLKKNRNSALLEAGCKKRPAHQAPASTGRLVAIDQNGRSSSNGI